MGIRPYKQIITGLLLVVGLSHCGTMPPKNEARSASTTDASTSSHATKKQNTSVVKDPNVVLRQLQGEYVRWQGVPYQLGGTSKKGVDCSAFVRAAMKNGLAIQLPRTTEQQVRVGRSISKSELRPGDLVFFKTGFFKKHVGIYLGDEVFMHASTSKGVMKSSLNSNYWRSHYWRSRRVR
ncbi:MAG: NlpC/P60 family protein [Thiohalomonadales bacterium]